MHIAPYVSDRKKKRARWRAYAFTTIGIAALYGIFFFGQWMILRSPIFRVDHVVVQGNSAVASADVIALAEASADSRNNFFRSMLTFNNMLLWPEAISQNTLRLIPQLATATISKNFFSHTITIAVTERSPFGIWCFSAPASADFSLSATSSTAAAGANTPCYWFDNTGTIFEKAGDTQGNIVSVVYDSAQSPQGMNQKILPDEFLGNFISIMNVVHASDLGVQDITLSDLSLEEVAVHTANGPVIYFSLAFPADEYLPVLQKLMLQSDFGTLQYVDCRTENRVFYK